MMNGNKQKINTDKHAINKRCSRVALRDHVTMRREEFYDLVLYSRLVLYFIMDCRGWNKKLDSILQEPDETAMLIKACKFMRFLAKKCRFTSRNSNFRECVIKYMITVTGLIEVPQDVRASCSVSERSFLIQTDTSDLFQ
jgi:hypothetical protein